MSTIGSGSYPGFVYKTESYKYYPYKEDPLFEEYVKNFSSLKENLVARFKERPGRYIFWYLVEKPYYVWSWNILQGQGDIYVYRVTKSWYQQSFFANISKQTMMFIHPAILCLALLSVPLVLSKMNRYRQQTLTVIFVISICVYYTFLYAVFAPWPRYSVPLRPELYLLAVWALYEGRQYLKGIALKNHRN